LEIVFHDVDRSPALEDAIRERAAKLEKFADDITSCRVTVQRPHRHHRQGDLHNVLIDVHVAGAEVVAGRPRRRPFARERLRRAQRCVRCGAAATLQDYVRIRRAGR
jgi:ribosome-associated translation inhibitor RaiA